MCEACGRITNFVRPADPATSISCSFAVATYAQAICAVRAYKILNNFEVDPDSGARLIIKVCRVYRHCVVAFVIRLVYSWG